MAEKRIVSTTEEQNGFAVRDLILIAVLLAAGAVLKLTVSSFLSFAGMKPNFMIAMYCLAIILTRPKVYQAAITGLISQIPLLNATPLVNIASELVGAVVCGILVAALVKVAADNKGLQNVVFPPDHRLHFHRVLRIHLRLDRGRWPERSGRCRGAGHVRGHGSWNRHYERRGSCHPDPGSALGAETLEASNLQTDSARHMPGRRLWKKGRAP